MVGKRRGEEDSSHDNKSLLKRVKKDGLEGGGLNESENLENLGIQNRKRAKEIGGGEGVLHAFGEGSDQGEKDVNECGEERMPDSSTKQQLRERLTKDGVDGNVQNGSTDQVLPHFKRPQSTWMMFLADKRPEVNNKRQLLMICK